MTDQLTHKVDSVEGIANAAQWMIYNVNRGLPGGPVVITIGREKRTSDQNDKFHPMIRDIIKGIDHPAKQYLGTNERQWRYFLVADWGQQMMVPSLDGSRIIVVAKKGTSELKKPDAISFIEYLYSVGADHNISWSEPSMQAFAQYRESQQGDTK